MEDDSIFLTWALTIVQIWLLHFTASMFLEKRNRAVPVQVIGIVITALAGALINQLHSPLLNVVVGLIQHTLYVLLFFHSSWLNALMLGTLVWGIFAFSETIFVAITTAQGIPLTNEFFSQDSIMVLGQGFTVLLSIAIVLLIRAVIQRRKGKKSLPKILLSPFCP